MPGTAVRVRRLVRLLLRVPRAARRVGRSLGQGFVMFGHAYYCGAVTAESYPWMTVRRQLRGPGPGHPERLVPGLAPSPAEVELWKQCDWQPERGNSAAR